MIFYKNVILVKNFFKRIKHLWRTPIRSKNNNDEIEAKQKQNAANKFQFQKNKESERKEPIKREPKTIRTVRRNEPKTRTACF